MPDPEFAQDVCFFFIKKLLHVYGKIYTEQHNAWFYNFFCLFSYKRCCMCMEKIHTKQHSVWFSLADLGGGCPAHAPSMVPNSFILHTFSLKSAHVGGPRPPNGCTPPLREILDPPLVLYFRACM